MTDEVLQVHSSFTLKNFWENCKKRKRRAKPRLKPPSKLDDSIKTWGMRIPKEDCEIVSQLMSFAFEFHVKLIRNKLKLVEIIFIIFQALKILWKRDTKEFIENVSEWLMTIFAVGTILWSSLMTFKDILEFHANFLCDE